MNAKSLRAALFSLSFLSFWGAPGQANATSFDCHKFTEATIDSISFSYTPRALLGYLYDLEVSADRQAARGLNEYRYDLEVPAEQKIPHFWSPYALAPFAPAGATAEQQALNQQFHQFMLAAFYAKKPINICLSLDESPMGRALAVDTFSYQ
ncbi:hypothetical protein [Zestomonas carbonaria]|uniref:Uncharacterized protein n=1 Tax=Zestomonas carbonaria TaxID=2762745 RepID=A0A7U7I8L6_9GAMM|nr:hypothetical protein [Pseudomonas carbonaria]CAD5106032.1 hypothetical protein PSEWESI4_00291 [Pseudomonas carbonaria]